jgi:hypothetical protein
MLAYILYLKTLLAYEEKCENPLPVVKNENSSRYITYIKRGDMGRISRKGFIQ